MTKINQWEHTGETVDRKLQIWCKIDIIPSIDAGDNTEYLKMQYRDNNGNVMGTTQVYPVNQIKLLHSLIDGWYMKHGK